MSKARNKQVKSKDRAPSLSRNSPSGKHILHTVIRGGREWQFHATKGWRNYCVAGGVGKPDRKKRIRGLK